MILDSDINHANSHKSAFFPTAQYVRIFVEIKRWEPWQHFQENCGKFETYQH